MKNNSKIILAIVGMAGAGKTEAATFFSKKGFEIFRFGAVIDDGLKEEGLLWTPDNNIYYREKIRKELGMAAVAMKMLPKIKKAIAENKRIILDGLYSWEEYIFLNHEIPNLIILCIYASPKIRYERLAVRKERVFNYKQAKERDFTELENLNKGGPIAIADYLIKNETTKDDFNEEMEKFYKDYYSR